MSQSLDRGLALADCLADGPRTLEELARGIGVHKSTALRLLRTLEARRFVSRSGPHHYRLGGALFDLASRALESHDARRAAAPALADLNSRTGHTVHLAVREGDEAVYVDKHDGRHSVRMYSRVGKRAPLHCTAVGKVLAAALPEAERAELCARLDYPRMTAATLRGPEALAAELGRTAERGWALDDAEHEDFVHCIAAPVRGLQGEVIAAMSVSVPKVLLDPAGLRALVPELLAAAGRASAGAGAGEGSEPSIDAAQGGTS